jgi:hypothetical protein
MSVVIAIFLASMALLALIIMVSPRLRLHRRRPGEAPGGDSPFMSVDAGASNGGTSDCGDAGGGDAG